MKTHPLAGDAKYKIFFWVLFGFVVFIVLSLLFGLAVQFLWNATVADMFSLTAISFWQAVGLFILAKLFFGFGVGGSGGGSKNWKGARGKKKQHKPDDLGELARDEDFRRFWQEEGKQAYDEYRAEGTHDNDPR